MKILTLCIILALSASAKAQNNVHKQSAEYEWPADQQVVKNLHEWQDLKFGVLIHWGLYSVPGIVESWSICDEDWITRDSTRTYQQYMDWYFSLADRFNPVLFNPTQWAEACKDAGMKYMIFTTKHHDGFCMFDSHQTDFTIAKHAFRNNSQADVLKYVLESYRAHGFMVGTYFSKPDWHSQDYWWDVYGKKGRNVNYPIQQYPAKWNRFKQFTYYQIEELVSRYGRVDILWLDGGWVYSGNRGQDIDMPRIASMVRQHQPGMIIVDRTIQGPYENYQTPERAVPDKQLTYPWESCIPLSDDWGYVKRPRWKSAQKIVNTLIEVVAKGGNLVLGVGPTPDGLLEPDVVERLKEIGSWLRKNGKAIYGTQTTPYYHCGDMWFTASKSNANLFALYVHEEGKPMPVRISWKNNIPKRGIRLLSTGKKLKTKIVGDEVIVFLPKNIEEQSFALEILN